MTAIGVIVALIVAVVGVAAGYFIGYNNRKKTAEAQIGSAEAEATRLVNEAIKTADQKRKEAVLEAKDEAFRLKAEVDAQKAEADKEIKQRRAEISRQENRIDQKETALDRKTEALEKKEEELKKRAADAEERLAEIDALRAKEMERLETLAGLSQEDAREVLLHKVDEELTHEKAVRVAAYETDLKENCDNIARNLIGQAVSRCAADHCSETTVSVVPLPSDEMKGRIIGREGRNIRALETATGECYLFTGLTSVGSDDSAIGFIMVDMVTKEPIMYEMSGATEEAAQLSAQGQVQDLGYRASFPIILNIDSQPTYFMTLKDDIGLIKQYAFVSVTNYSTVGTGESVSEALRDYESKLVTDGVTTIGNSLSGEVESVEGVVLRIANEYSDGRTIYKFLLQSPQDILFTAQSSVSQELALTQEGDRVSVSYTLTTSGIANVDAFDNLEFTQKAA